MSVSFKQIALCDPIDPAECKLLTTKLFHALLTKASLARDNIVKISYDKDVQQFLYKVDVRVMQLVKNFKESYDNKQFKIDYVVDDIHYLTIITQYIKALWAIEKLAPKKNWYKHEWEAYSFIPPVEKNFDAFQKLYEPTRVEETTPDMEIKKLYKDEVSNILAIINQKKIICETIK